METVVCNCCGSDSLAPVYSMPDALFPSDERFHVVECRQCGLGFVNPRPAPSEMQRFYPADYYAGFSTDRSYHQARYAREAEYLRGVTTPGRAPKLLDVGCAHGDFPRFMQTQGWEVEGVEVSTTTLPITDFTVYRQDFASADIPTARYDAVTAWAVMEHLHDPAAYFRQAARVLAPGGTFVFLVTNFNSLASRRLYVEDVPRHLYFFTESSVRRYLGQVGLRLERADYSNKIFELPATNWLRYAMRRAVGRPFEYEDRRSASHFRRTHKLPPGLGSTVRFYLDSPLSLVEHAFVPLVDRLSILARNYSIVTYVARRE
jgi:SAM-dependent methyltransferase